jgi:hypothetical protein
MSKKLEKNYFNIFLSNKKHPASQHQTYFKNYIGPDIIIY